MPTTTALIPYDTLKDEARPQQVILINDCTLREGVQGAGITLIPEIAVRLAQDLATAGVLQVQLGMPGRSDADRLAIAAVRGAAVPVRIEAMTTLYGASWRDEVDRAAASHPDILHLFHAASDQRLATIGMTRDDLLGRITEGIRYAVGLGPEIVFTPTDTTRVDPSFLSHLALTVQKAGAHRIGIADTAGCASPRGMRTITEVVLAAVTIPVQVHCHNDFGLALPNTLAAIEAGVSVVDVTVLGVGERAGNAALDEVAVALKVFYGLDTGIRLDRLTELARSVADALGLLVPVMKPLVGPNAFRHHLGIHAREPEAFEPIAPESVGNVRWLGGQH